MKRVFISVLFFCLILILWEILIRVHGHLIFVLPRPSTIIKCCLKYSDLLWRHTFVTFKEMLGSVILAILISFPLAWGMTRYPSLRSTLQPLFVIVQCIPMFALAPIMVLWLGWSYMTIVIPTILMIFFPLTINIYQGLSSPPSCVKDYFKIHQATSWQLFWKLQLPCSIPYLLAGLRISTSMAGISAIAGEWAGGQAGLGVLMIESRRSTDLDITFAALIFLTALSLSFYGIIVGMEKVLFLRKNQIVANMCLFIGLFLCAGCQRDPTSNSLQTKMLLDWLPNPNHVPIFAGIEKGIFKKYNIDLILYKLNDPGDSLSLLATQQADLALYYMPETYLANKKGAGLATIGILFREPLNAFIFRKGEGIFSQKDLNEKKIGYCVGSFGIQILKKMLDKSEVKPSGIYNVNFDLVSTLATKQVDIIYGAYWNIEIEHLRSLGLETSYMPLKIFGNPNYYELIIIGKEHTRCAQPDFIKNFKLAMQESIDYSTKHPEEAFELYCLANPEKTDKTLQWERKAWLKTFPVLAKNQDIDPAIWADVANWITD